MYFAEYAGDFANKNLGKKVYFLSLSLSLILFEYAHFFAIKYPPLQVADVDATPIESQLPIPSFHSALPTAHFLFLFRFFSLERKLITITLALPLSQLDTVSSLWDTWDTRGEGLKEKNKRAVG